MAGALVATGLSVAAASFADESGDANAAPDITSIRVSESADGTRHGRRLHRELHVAPERQLDQRLVRRRLERRHGLRRRRDLLRYLSSGQLELFEWDGLAMLRKALPARITGRFADGELTLTVPTSDLGGDSSFGVLAISSLRQQVILSQFTSSDFAPDQGRSAYTARRWRPSPIPGNDEDVAPDIVGVRVDDTTDGWIRFAVATPNYAALTADSALWIGVDTDNRAATSDDDRPQSSGSGIARGDDDRALATGSGGWVEEAAPDLVRGAVARRRDGRSSALAIGGARRFGFSVTTADFNPQTGVVNALTWLPSTEASIATRSPTTLSFRLVTGRLSATPRQPRAGARFAVTLPVRRSDTGRAIATGTVTCRAFRPGRAPWREGGRDRDRCALLVRGAQVRSGTAPTGHDHRPLRDEGRLRAVPYVVR